VNRFNDWQLRFETFTAARRSTPFVWGSSDCVLFAADCVMAITGGDVPGELRAHTCARTAAQAVRRLGGIPNVAKLAWGESLPSTLASVGDVVLLDYRGRESLGICNGQTAIGQGINGLVTVPMDFALRTWKI
jgi:hypothetical protein